jgi:hypothetical protein
MSSRESKRKHKYDSGKSSKRKKKDSKLTIVDDDLMDDELWVEKKVEPIEVRFAVIFARGLLNVKPSIASDRRNSNRKESPVDFKRTSG